LKRANCTNSRQGRFTIGFIPRPVAYRLPIHTLVRRNGKHSLRRWMNAHLDLTMELNPHLPNGKRSNHGDNSAIVAHTPADAHVPIRKCVRNGKRTVVNSPVTYGISFQGQIAHVSQFLIGKTAQIHTQIAHVGYFTWEILFSPVHFTLTSNGRTKLGRPVNFAFFRSVPAKYHTQLPDK
jgi:hypothetical protein